MNMYFYGYGHQFLYDADTLTEALEQSGFSDIRQFVLGESDDPELRDVERHHIVMGAEGPAINEYITMVIQARAAR